MEIGITENVEGIKRREVGIRKVGIKEEG
jgi:hypothetical protein